jgi:hypothetical protein
MERYTANIIAENLFSQCDSEGRSFLFLKEIVDHSKDNSAVSIAEGFTVGFNGNKVPKKTTRGWKLLCQWKDDTTTWVPLVDLTSVVSRDSVRIAFLMAAFHDVDVMSCNISNAYLNAPCREKIWFVAGPEFGSRQGQVVKIV